MCKISLVRYEARESRGNKTITNRAVSTPSIIGSRRQFFSRFLSPFSCLFLFFHCGASVFLFLSQPLPFLFRVVCSRNGTRALSSLAECRQPTPRCSRKNEERALIKNGKKESVPLKRAENSTRYRAKKARVERMETPSDWESISTLIFINPWDVHALPEDQLRSIIFSNWPRSIPIRL